MSSKEEDRHNQPGLKGPVKIRRGIPENEKSDYDEEVGYGRKIAFDVEDEILR